MSEDQQNICCKKQMGRYNNFMGTYQVMDTITCDKSALLRALWQLVDDMTAAVIAVHWLKSGQHSHPDCGGQSLLQYLFQMRGLDYNLRKAIAENPSTPPEILQHLAESFPVTVASNPSTPQAILQDLAKHTYPEMREALASNPSTPQAILQDLAEDVYFWVRERVAGNPGASPKMLWRLAEDECVNVRKAVGCNPSTPSEILSRLAADQD